MPNTPDGDTNPSPDADPTQRRRFIGQLVGGAAAVAAAAYARAVPAQALATDSATRTTGHTTDHAAGHVPGPAHSEWDLSWTDRLTAGGTHKQVFDAPEIAEGTALNQARFFFVQYKDVYGTTDADMRAVLVFRHKAIPVVVGDAIWDKYDFIGKKITKLKDPTTGAWARRNPFLNAKDSDKYSLIFPDGGLDTHIGRGAIVLGCNLALGAFAREIATRTKQDKDVVRDELKAALIPSVTLVPSGVFGVIRAEQGGCAYIRGT